MKPRIKILQDRKAALAKDMRAITDLADKDSGGILSVQQQTDFAANETELLSVNSELAREERLQEFERSLATKPDGNTLSTEETAALEGKKKPPRIDFLSQATPKHFKGEKAQENAYRAGQFLRATIWKDEAAALWCREHGVSMLAAQSGGQNTTGGVLVPEELANTVITLREQYGVFRRECKVWPMGSDTLIVPRRTGGLTAYFVGDTTATTESNKTWDGVELSAKELACLARYPLSLAADAVIMLADDLASEIAYAFSLLEDQCGFIGDGTSTYGGMVGAVNKLNDGNHGGGVFTAASGHVGFDTLTQADYTGLIGTLPQYAQLAGAKWYISQAGYANSMQRLMYASGGNTVENMAGGTKQMFLGYEVVITQVMNATLGSDVSKIKCLFGNLSLAAAMGARKDIAIASSAERYFEYRQVGIQGVERFDINVHSVGSSTAAGPLVALKTPAS